VAIVAGLVNPVALGRARVDALEDVQEVAMIGVLFLVLMVAKVHALVVVQQDVPEVVSLLVH